MIGTDNISKDLPVRLAGVTSRFQGKGRSLGYPTANISANIPLPDGIYFGFADLGHELKNKPALIFIGTPVTVGDKGRRVEANILDIPDKDYYGQELLLDIRKFHRGNEKFADVGELRAAIRRDEAAGRAWFAAQK